MCDPEIIAAILEELGSLNEKEDEDKKEDVNDRRSKKDNLKNSKEEEQK